VGLAGAEQHAIRDDGGCAATALQQAQEKGQEQQFGLLGLDDLLQVLGGGFVVQAASKGRIGQDQGVFLGVVLGRLGQGVAIADVRVLQSVQYPNGDFSCPQFRKPPSGKVVNRTPPGNVRNQYIDTVCHDAKIKS
jgi:hypothetical protein